MKLLTKAFWIAAALSIIVAGSAFADDGIPTDVTISQSGADVTVSWTAPDFDGIDKYQVQIVKEKTNTDSAYKTVTVDSDETSAEVTISAKGYYHARVRLRDVNNKWHDWSNSTSTVTVTSSDIGSDSSSSGSSSVVASGVSYTTNYTGGNTSYYSNGTLYNTQINAPTGGNLASMGLTTLSSPNAMNPTTNNVYSSSSSVVNTKTVAAFTYAQTGWQFEQAGMWYLNEDGTYPVSTWKQIDGKYYHFNPSGYLEVNTWVLENDGWRYVGDNAIMCHGWNLINNKWYYFNMNSGKLEGPGLIIVDQKYYYIGQDGARIQNASVNGHYFGADGALTYGQ